MTALACLHNFIKVHDPADEINMTPEEAEAEAAANRPAAGVLHQGITDEESLRARAMRDQIAQEMWRDYQISLANRRR